MSCDSKFEVLKFWRSRRGACGRASLHKKISGVPCSYVYSNRLRLDGAVSAAGESPRNEHCKLFRERPCKVSEASD